MVSNLGIAQYQYNNGLLRWQDVATGRIVANDTVTGEMHRHQTATFNRLEDVTRSLYAGQINVQQWEISVAAELKNAHLAQSMFAVGGRNNMTSVEFGRVGGVLADEYRYLHGFAQDIANGKQSLAQALARVNQYGNSTQQSYWREWSLHRKGRRVNWRLSPADHCAQCVDLANGSPYNYDDLPTYPGAGETTCRGNCKCYLEDVA